MKRRASVLTVAVMLALGCVREAVGQAPASGTETLQPMASDADPSYAAATIKLSKPDEVVETIPPVGYRTVLPMITVAKMVSFAYDLQGAQVVGAPAWVESETYDFQGVSDTPGRPDIKQLKSMLSKLLVDRFELKFHWEKRDLPAYALGLGKKGATLTQSKEDPQGPPTFFIKWNGAVSRTLTAKNVGMEELAHMMQANVVDRPVVDQTGLPGRYDFVLTWADESQSGPGVEKEGGDVAGIFTAMQEQLGLKLSAEKTAVRVMVVDRVERPSAN